MTESYPFQHHPCWSESRTELWERIHLPVARCCNVKCAFCDGLSAVSCHVQRPGTASRTMPAERAVEVAKRELSRRADLHIVAVAGPGEPLANAATFEVMNKLVDSCPKVHFCLSTNGVLLADRVNKLVRLGIESLSVSMSTSEPATAATIYEWAELCGTRVTGIGMGKRIVEMQLAGIRQATDAGIHVKINSVLIPEVNDEDIATLAEDAAFAGAELQNIIPLVPCGTMSTYRPPSCEELEQARAGARKHIKQFCSCRQCRADVVGIPGADTLIWSG